MNKEKWKQIKNYPDYWISSDGRLLSRRVSLSKIVKGHIIYKYRNGKRISVHRFGLRTPGVNHPKIKYAHNLVWEAFKGTIPKNVFVEHIDENTLNNKLDNLTLIRNVIIGTVTIARKRVHYP